MRINESDFSYYDAMVTSMEANTSILINEMAIEFQNWLSSNGYIIEAAANTKQAAVEWKLNKANSIKNNIARAIQYASEQAAKNNIFLERNREVLLNVKKYPVKPDNELKNAPNYAMALQRLSSPISSSIGSINLAKVDPENNPNTNGWLKQNIIHTYRGGDFSQFCKAYFYGTDNKRVNMNTNQVTMLLQEAFQYCYQYAARMRGAQTDAQGIISYINKDPNTGQVAAATQTDLSKIQANQQQNAAQNMGRASTNPMRNAGQVNADTNMELFMADHFGADWDTLNEADVTKPQTNTTQQSQAAINQQNASKPTSPNGAPVDNSSLAIAKHRAVCEIIEECFNAKITAMGMIYRDFMFIMRSHVASYKGPSEGNVVGSQRVQQTNQNQLAPQAK